MSYPGSDQRKVLIQRLPNGGSRGLRWFKGLTAVQSSRFKVQGIGSIRAVRLQRKLGSLSTETLNEIKQALRSALDRKGSFAAELGGLPSKLEFAGSGVAMEGYTGYARPLDSLIRARGYRLYNINNLKLARFKEIFPGAAKTDRIDARKGLEQNSFLFFNSLPG
jgi:hypothetical protein